MQPPPTGRNCKFWGGATQRGKKGGGNLQALEHGRKAQGERLKVDLSVSFGIAGG